MRARLSVLCLVFGLALFPAWATAAAPPQPDSEVERPFSAGGGGIVPDRIPRSLLSAPGSGPEAQATDPRTLNINIVTEPPTLDPSRAVWSTSDSTSVDVTEQLFIGLVDLDDETGYVYPELATSWTVSPDGGVYTFTLRGDATWSDGHPVTAEDVRYGILRTLDPATDSDYAYVLAFLIQNASEYNSGAITDPDLVGVKALDATHLEITMMQPAAYALPILSMWMARPLPKWAIEAHGSAWTEPANIVTSGAYRLKEWVHNDHILLEKNPAYFNAADVQIEEVKMWMVSEGAAWTMYLNGELDTVTVPYSVILTLDPIVRQEVRFDPTPCTYYYGFTTTNPPFDNPLVRKAFVAATDREGLIREVTRAYQHPAVTFTPPGIFGYVDGAAEGVGIPYDPARARQYLAQAGYPGGTGLPPVTLWHNTSTGHQAIAEYIRQGWQSVLGVNVIRQDMAWSDYRDAYREGQFQVWRLGWCPDYPDAINFLRDVFARGGAVNPVGGGVNWFNPTYESVVAQAAAEQDPAVRKTLYKQAEEILAETDAVIIPIYHYTRVMATRPYLDCPQGWYLGDIAGWRFTDVSAVIGAEGGSLTSYTGDTVVQMPVGAVSEPVVMTITPAYGMPPAANFVGTGHTFDLEAVYESSGLPAQPAPGQSYTVTVDYEQSDVGVAAENTLALYGWDGAAWTQEGVVSSVDTSADRVTAQVDHFSLFTILGETKLVFLPLVMR